MLIFFWIGLGISDELGNGRRGKRWMDHHDIRPAHNTCHRYNVAGEFKIELLVEARVDRVRSTGEEQRVTVGCCLRDPFGRSIARRARTIFDKKWLAEPL
jgi:hypothetical protein